MYPSPTSSEEDDLEDEEYFYGNDDFEDDGYSSMRREEAYANMLGHHYRSSKPSSLMPSSFMDWERYPDPIDLDPYYNLPPSDSESKFLNSNSFLPCMESKDCSTARAGVMALELEHVDLESHRKNLLDRTQPKVVGICPNPQRKACTRSKKYGSCCNDTEQALMEVDYFSDTNDMYLYDNNLAERRQRECSQWSKGAIKDQFVDCKKLNDYNKAPRRETDGWEDYLEPANLHPFYNPQKEFPTDAQVVDCLRQHDYTKTPRREFRNQDYFREPVQRDLTLNHPPIRPLKENSQLCLPFKDTSRACCSCHEAPGLALKKWEDFPEPAESDPYYNHPPLRNQRRKSEGCDICQEYEARSGEFMNLEEYSDPVHLDLFDCHPCNWQSWPTDNVRVKGRVHENKDPRYASMARKQERFDWEIYAEPANCCNHPPTRYVRRSTQPPDGYMDIKQPTDCSTAQEQAPSRTLRASDFQKSSRSGSVAGIDRQKSTSPRDFLTTVKIIQSTLRRLYTDRNNQTRSCGSCNEQCHSQSVPLSPARPEDMEFQEGVGLQTDADVLAIEEYDLERQVDFQELKTTMYRPSSPKDSMSPVREHPSMSGGVQLKAPVTTSICDSVDKATRYPTGKQYMETVERFLEARDSDDSGPNKLEGSMFVGAEYAIPKRQATQNHGNDVSRCPTLQERDWAINACPMQEKNVHDCEQNESVPVGASNAPKKIMTTSHLTFPSRLQIESLRECAKLQEQKETRAINCFLGLTKGQGSDVTPVVVKRADGVASNGQPTSPCLHNHAPQAQEEATRSVRLVSESPSKCAPSNSKYNVGSVDDFLDLHEQHVQNNFAGVHLNDTVSGVAIPEDMVVSDNQPDSPNFHIAVSKSRPEYDMQKPLYTLVKHSEGLDVEGAQTKERNGDFLNVKPHAPLELEGVSAYTQKLLEQELVELLRDWQLLQTAPVQSNIEANNASCPKAHGMVDVTHETGYMSKYMKTQAIRASVKASNGYKVNESVRALPTRLPKSTDVAEKEDA